MKKKYIILIALVVIMLVGLGLFYYLTTEKEEKLEEVVLTEEERVKLRLTDEERKNGITIKEKEKMIEEEKRKELEEKGKTPEEIKVVQIKKIIDKEIKFTVFSADNSKFLYFDPTNKEVYQSNTDGIGEQVLTNAKFDNLYNVSWSPNREKTVLTFSSDKGLTKKYHFFNLSSQEDIEYEDKYQNVTISYDGENVAYVFHDSAKDKYNLSVAKPDLSSWRKIRELGKEEIETKWFSNNNLAVYSATTAFEEGQLDIYNVGEGADHYTFLSKRWGLNPLFSPDGKKVIFNDNDTKNARFPIIWIAGVENKIEPRKLQLSTLVEKCAWAKDSVSIFCGIPENYSNFFIQPDDYYKGKFVSKDSFYKIDTNSGEQKKLADFSQFNKDYDVYKPLVSEDQKKMYFTRKHDGKFYGLIMP